MRVEIWNHELAMLVDMPLSQDKLKALMCLADSYMSSIKTWFNGEFMSLSGISGANRMAEYIEENPFDGKAGSDLMNRLDWYAKDRNMYIDDVILYYEQGVINSEILAKCGLTCEFRD